ncbi:MAG: ABC transporter permease [Devosiaceae bacterium]|nr:ABC transporter permease [Devosiaceae bacterium]
MKQYFLDTSVIWGRSMKLALQNPIWMVISLMQPILYLTLFGPILQSITQVPGFPPGDAWEIFVPGLLVQLGIFGAAFVGFGIIAEWRAGVIERMLVTPVHRTALLTGMVMRDVIVVSVQGAVLIGLSFLFGLRVSPAAFGVGLVIIALLAAAFSYLSYAAALALKSEDALAPMINSFALPILLLSGILLPMSLAPRWLQVVSDFNPIKHVVNGLRAVFREEIFSVETGLGIAIAITIVALSVYVGNSTIKKLAK